MALHIKLTNNNNPWGIKTSQSGSPIYEHIVDFQSDSLKNQFIADAFFKGDLQWKDQVKKSIGKGDTEFDENEIIFKVDVITEYPDENWRSILNKNYAVVYDDETDQFSFWGIQGATNKNHNIITFQGWRDWMFDLDIKTLFDPNKQAILNRAHVDDLIKEGNNVYWNNQQSSENSIVEPIENFDENNFTNKSSRIIATIDYSSKFVSSNGKTYDDFKREMDKGWTAFIFQGSIGDKKVYITGMNGTTQYPLYTNTKKGDADLPYERSYMYLKFGATNEIAPYIIFMVPNSDLIHGKIGDSDYHTNTYFKSFFNSSSQLLKIVPLPYSPLHLESIDSIIWNTYHQCFLINMKTNYSGYAPNDSKQNLTDIEYGMITQGVSTSDNYSFFGKHLVNGIDFESDETEINIAIDYNVNVNNAFLGETNLAKLHKYPYQQIYLKSVSGAKLNLQQQLVKNTIKWKLGFTYALDVWHLIIMINDVEGIRGIYNTPFQYGLRLDDILPFTMPRETSAYNDYANRNQDQINQQSRRYGISAMLGGAGTFFGIGQSLNNNSRENPYRQAEIERNEEVFNTPHPKDLRNRAGRRSAMEHAQALQNLTTLALSQTPQSIGISMIGNIVLGGVESMVSSIMNIQQQRAMLSDLKRNPSQVSGNGGDVMGILPMTNLSPIEFTDELWPELKKSVAWFFQLYGSKLDSVARNINNYIISRYHFNYLETQDIYQNINDEINNGAKTLINNSFNQGVWIWHYRDKATWKGVKNFNVNNVQMNMLTMKEGESQCEK